MKDYRIKKNYSCISIIVVCPRCGREGKLVKKNDRKIFIEHEDGCHSFGRLDSNFERWMEIYQLVREMERMFYQQKKAEFTERLGRGCSYYEEVDM